LGAHDEKTHKEEVHAQIGNTKRLSSLTSNMENIAKDILDSRRFFIAFTGLIETEYCRYALNRNRIINKYYPFLGAVGLLLFAFADSIILPQVADEFFALRVIGVVIIVERSRYAAEWQAPC
jgi:hypothetical protein